MLARQRGGVSSVQAEAHPVGVAEPAQDGVPTLRRGVLEITRDDPAEGLHAVAGASREQRVQPEMVLRDGETSDQQANQEQVGQQTGGNLRGKRNAQGGRPHAYPGAAGSMSM